MTLPAVELPYVHGRPAPLRAGSGMTVLATCALAFAALLWLPKAVPGTAGEWLGASAFVVLQVLGLVVAVGPAWTALFRRPRPRDLLVALLAVPLVIGLPALVAIGIVGEDALSANATISAAGGLAPPQVANLFAVSAVQLLGEELVTILPLLVLLSALHRSGLPAWLAVGIAWVATSLAFGALHLPTYQWHVGQALLVIGTARVVLTGVYLLTRNLWASTVAHVANDWSIMAFAMVAAHAARAGG